MLFIIITYNSSIWLSLGNSCFDGCFSFSSIAIPESVTSLGRNCFPGCSSLSSITIFSAVTYLRYNKLSFYFSHIFVCYRKWNSKMRIEPSKLKKRESVSSLFEAPNICLPLDALLQHWSLMGSPFSTTPSNDHTKVFFINILPYCSHLLNL
jgi:hypothetical protein